MAHSFEATRCAGIRMGIQVRRYLLSERKESYSTTCLAVVFLHGGPGGGFDPQDRSFFNPEKYKVLLPVHDTISSRSRHTDHPPRPARLGEVHATCVARGKHDVGSREGHREAARGAQD